MRRILLSLTVLTALLSPAISSADEVYYDIPLEELTLTAGSLSLDSDGSNPEGACSLVSQATWQTLPRVRLSGEGEAFLVEEARTTGEESAKPQRVRGCSLVVRLPKPGPLSGQITVYDWTGVKSATASFTVPNAKAAQEAAKSFWNSRARHHQLLSAADLPGAAWFRHEAEVSADMAASDDRSKAATVAWSPRRACLRGGARVPGNDRFHDAIDLFSGTRALSENLQLERLVCPTQNSHATVDLATIPGITVGEITWAPLIEGKKPQRDTLARFVPSDNYGLFFPTFRSMIDLLDEANQFGTPALAWLEPRFEDNNTREKYMKQICLGTDFMARQLGPAVIASVAMTGADPFLRMGSDVTVLFEATQADILESYIKSKQESALGQNPGSQKLEGTLLGVRYSGVASANRQLSSYIVRLGDVIAVSNSVKGIERVVAAFQGKIKSVNDLGEYTYFRDRYKVAKDGETAFLLLSDEAIRKWASPGWRIADSRRVRMAGVLSELAAGVAEGERSGNWPAAEFEESSESAAKESTGNGNSAETRGAGGMAVPSEAGQRRFAVQTTVPGEEQFYATLGDLRSPVYGSLQFMTPIVELDVSKASPEEVESYGWFRDQYQNGWRRYFDPIGIQFKVSAQVVSADITALPLLAVTDYRDLMELTMGSSLPVAEAYPAEALAVFGISINRESKLVRELTNFANAAAPSVLRSGLNFVGNWLQVYVADDPLWERLVAQKSEREMERQLEKEFARIPIVLEMAISNPLGLASVLTSVRALVESSAPGLTVWENFKYKGSTYVRVTASLNGPDDPEQRKVSVYYCAANNVFTLTLSEDLLKKAIDRRSKGKSSKKAAEGMGGMKWLGENCGGAATRRVLELLEPLFREEYNREMRRAAWTAIPVLNEWKALFPDQDPVMVHERLFGTKLVCPGGGLYVWNQAEGTMESSVYGHPGQQKDGPGLLRAPLDRLSTVNFGLKFENAGLRAIVSLGRKK